MSDWLSISLIAVLLLANAFFVGAEFALISSRRDRLEGLLEQGKNRAKIVINASRNVSLMLAGAQLGITLCSLLLMQFGEPAVAHQLELAVSALGVPLPSYVVHGIAFTVTLVALTLLHVLIGEMVPKNIAFSMPDRALFPPNLWTTSTLSSASLPLNSITKLRRHSIMLPAAPLLPSTSTKLYITTTVRPIPSGN